LKFQPDQLDGVNTVSTYVSPMIGVNGRPFDGSILVPWRGAVVAWPPATFDGLSREHFDALIAFAPELIIFGSGLKQRFAAPALIQALIARRIGVESMDTAAACRTFNVLVTEGRQVLGAFLAV